MCVSDVKKLDQGGGRHGLGDEVTLSLVAAKLTESLNCSTTRNVGHVCLGCLICDNVSGLRRRKPDTMS